MAVTFGILIGTLTFWLNHLLTCKHEKGVVMPEVSEQKEVKIEAPPSEMIIFGGTSIHNTQFASKQFLNTLGFILTKFEPNHKLFSIILDDKNFPKDGEKNPLFAKLITDTMGVAINLLHHFNAAYDTISEPTDNGGICHVAIKTIIWHSLLISIFHEIHHAKRTAAAENKDAIDWNDEEEEIADNWATKRIEDLAKCWDLEIPAIENEPFFGVPLTELREMLNGEDAAWAKHQCHMFDNGIVSSTIGSAEEGMDIMTFKEFIRIQADDYDDKSWESEVVTPEIVTEPEKGLLNVTLVVSPPATIAEAVAPAGIQQTTPIMDDEIGDIEYMFNNIDDIPQIEQTAPVATVAASSIEGFVNPVASAMAMGNDLPNTPQQIPTGLIRVAEPTIPPIEQLKTVKAVLLRLYTHVFTKCGFNPTAPVSFDNPGAVAEPVSIGDIPNATQIFLSMDTVDQTGGQMKDVQIIDQIRGQVFSKSGMPGYWLYLNINGYKLKRVFVPQNPNKEKNGMPAPMAQNVRKGWAVMWFIANHPVTGDSEMKAKIETRPGGAIIYQERPFENRS